MDGGYINEGNSYEFFFIVILFNISGNFIVGSIRAGVKAQGKKSQFYKN